MSQEQQPELVTINIDGCELAVPKGSNIIAAAATVGIEIPHYCYHPKLSIAGNCRMCLVEMGTPMRDRATGEAILHKDGQPKIGWQANPAIACATNASQGLHIRTKSALARESQKGVMEFLLANHPLDCPICDQAGECSLQEYATDYGRGYSRFVEDKNVKPKRTRLGPRITLDDERCILCSRCVRFCQEVIEEDVLGFVDRGSYSTLTCYPGQEFTSNYSLNTVDICPVGALTSTDFRFKMRPWFLRKTPSICTESSVGVNTFVWSREGKIYRITPRENDAVNSAWMPDSGRERYKLVEADDRLTQYKLNGNKVSLDEALERAKDFLSVGKAAIVASGHLSVEEQYLLKKIAIAQRARVYFVAKPGVADGLLISNDHAPNLRGGLVTGLIDQLPQDDLQELRDQLEAGSVQTIIVYGEDLVAEGIPEALLRKLCLIYLGTHSNPTADMARVVLPMLMVFEKSGTFVNQQGRLQKFQQAVPGPAGLLPDIYQLNRLHARLIGEQPPAYPTLDELWQEMSETIDCLAGLSFSTVPETGVLLEHIALTTLPFGESDSLNYKPKAPSV